MLNTVTLVMSSRVTGHVLYLFGENKLFNKLITK